jgi:hypothetical protein
VTISAPTNAGCQWERRLVWDWVFEIMAFSHQ